MRVMDRMLYELKRKEEGKGCKKMDLKGDVDGYESQYHGKES